MFRRIFSYIRTAFGMRAESMMDPAVQIEQAVSEARKQDRQLREQAARVVAHRSELQMKLERAVDAAAKAKANATQALTKVKQAQTGGNVAEVERWSKVARSMALELETQERLVEGLKTQFTTAQEQADLAKQQVENNAFRLRELTTKRMELLGKLEQARMQEQVNKTLDQLNRPMDAGAPSLGEVEDKINKRMAMASAKAELESSSIESAQRELEQSSIAMAGQARLDELMGELGMTEEADAGGSDAGQVQAGGTDSGTLLLDDGGIDSAQLQQQSERAPVEEER